MPLSPEAEQRLIAVGKRLIDQDAARIVVPANDTKTGFWFGGGNMVEAPDGSLILVGRYRNAGDSRVGVSAGTRGLELAVFRSTDGGNSFSKTVSLSKADLSTPGHEVLSIEGCAIRFTADGRAELFISTEKNGIGYPPGFADFLKPGTGVWTIDVLLADSVEELANAAVTPVLSANEPEVLHIKDPFLYSDTLLFCSHPFCWSSSNTGMAGPTATPAKNEEESCDDFGDGLEFESVPVPEFETPNFDFFPRGTTWDVAMTRGTAIVDLPSVGAIANKYVSLFFYDGGECVRNLDEHAAAVKRPRGYSCEELGGLAYIVDSKIERPTRLSRHHAMFVSPHATGCSRYIDVLATKDQFIATWQQAQPDGSQPLVMNSVPVDEIVRLLS